MSAFKGAPKEEKNQEKQTWSNLMGLGETARQEAGTLGAEGKEAKGDAVNYFQRLLKGDRTAIAPGVNAATATSDAQKREQATMGTSRGGGTNAANQTRENDLRGQAMSLFGNQQQGAAGNLASIGQNDIGQMISSLGLSGNIESSTGDLLHRDIQEKGAAAHKLWGSLLGGAAKLGMSLAFPPAAPLLAAGGPMDSDT